MTARIFKPAKNAMQSGVAKTRRWLLEFDQEMPREVEPLMGYTSTGDMLQEVQLSFDSKEEAIAFAERNGIAYRLIEPKAREPKRLSYSDNFKFSRLEPWSH